LSVAGQLAQEHYIRVAPIVQQRFCSPSPRVGTTLISRVMLVMLHRALYLRNARHHGADPTFNLCTLQKLLGLGYEARGHSVLLLGLFYSCFNTSKMLDILRLRAERKLSFSSCHVIYELLARLQKRQVACTNR
jgi:hypothetical protein